MKESINNWVSRLHHRTKKRADQVGITLQEVLIGIAIAAVIAASSIFLGARFIGQGQFASARQTLSTATLSTEQVFASIIEGGGRNYLATQINDGAGTTQTALPTTDAVVTADVDVKSTPDQSSIQLLSKVAVNRLNSLGEDINFIPSAGTETGTSCSTGYVCSNNTTSITNLNERDVWVEVIPAGGQLARSGQAIRLGMVAGDGSTLCVVIVKQLAGTATASLGKGYQAVAPGGTTATCGMGDTTGAVTGLPGHTSFSSSLNDPN